MVGWKKDGGRHASTRVFVGVMIDVRGEGGTDIVRAGMLSLKELVLYIFYTSD